MINDNIMNHDDIMIFSDTQWSKTYWPVTSTEQNHVLYAAQVMDLGLGAQREVAPLEVLKTQLPVTENGIPPK